MELSIEFGQTVLENVPGFLPNIKSLNGKYWMKKKRQGTVFVTFTVCQITDGSLQFRRIERIFIFLPLNGGLPEVSCNQIQSSLLTFFSFIGSCTPITICHFVRLLSFSVISFPRRVFDTRLLLNRDINAV